MLQAIMFMQILKIQLVNILKEIGSPMDRDNKLPLAVITDTTVKFYTSEYEVTLTRISKESDKNED